MVNEDEYITVKHNYFCNDISVFSICKSVTSLISGCRFYHCWCRWLLLLQNKTNW